MSIQSAPNHVGIIMDGNRRWAKAKGLPTLQGHKKGLETLIDIANYALGKGVKYLTVYAFSTENWNRSQTEVSYLIGLIPFAFKKYLKMFTQKDIKLVMMTNYSGLDSKIIKQFKDAEIATKNNTSGTLSICFNYGGQQEIVDACNKIIDSGVRQVDSKDFSKYLYNPDIPPIDLLIRTSGEQRISNFMLWRAAYSELLFTNTLWPDFNHKDFDMAVEEYKKRQRRFGG